MKTNPMKHAALILIPGAFLALNACSPSIPGEQGSTMRKTATSTTAVDTFKSTATVTAIDSSTRKIKVVYANGKRSTIKCGPEIVNFRQIHINDQVKLTVTVETAVYLDKGKPAASATGSTTVALAPLGAKPGAIVADTVQATVKITGIDSSNRTITYRTKAGDSDTIKVGEHIDLTKVKVGDSVTVRASESVALLVETP